MVSYLVQSVLLSGGLPLLIGVSAWLLGATGSTVTNAPRRADANESLVSRVVLPWLWIDLALVTALCVATLQGGNVDVALPHWFTVGDHAFEIEFRAEPLTSVWLWVAQAVSVTVAHFARRYLHRERGWARFWFCFALANLGVRVVALAASLDVLIVGWEWVGLASCLLIAFFSQRSGPSNSALRAFASYRIADIGMLVGVVLLHHAAGSSRIDRLVPNLTHAALIGALLVFAAWGKASQGPFSKWIYGAGEGPTPSTAWFYGGPAIHLGVLLALRASPAIESSVVARSVIAATGLWVAARSALAARVLADAKGVVAAASQAQIGLMFVEIAAGFPRLAMVHCMLHMVMRTAQLLLAGSVLQEHNRSAAAFGGVLPTRRPWFIPPRFELAFYRWALTHVTEPSAIEKLALSAWRSKSSATSAASTRSMQFAEESDR